LIISLSNFVIPSKCLKNFNLFYSFLSLNSPIIWSNIKIHYSQGAALIISILFA